MEVDGIELRRGRELFFYNMGYIILIHLIGMASGTQQVGLSLSSSPLYSGH